MKVIEITRSLRLNWRDWFVRAVLYIATAFALACVALILKGIFTLNTVNAIVIALAIAGITVAAAADFAAKSDYTGGDAELDGYYGGEDK